VPAQDNLVPLPPSGTKIVAVKATLR